MADRTDDLEYLEGERGPVTVPQRRTRRTGIMALALIAFVSLVGSALVYVALAKRTPVEQLGQRQLMTNEAAVPPRTFSLSSPPEDNQVKAEATTEEGRALPPEDELQSKRLSSSLMGTAQAAQPPQPTSSPMELPSDTGRGQGGLATALVSTDTPPRAAGMIANRNLTLAKGTFIDCVLETRIDSTVPGMTSCVVTRNIYSDNGKVLLIERGSKITGEYQSGLQQGQRRLFVLWNRIKTVHGVTMNLDSPGTDPLGGLGMPGYVDRHFAERFGAAILLSMIDDAFATASNLTQRSHDNQTIVYNSTASNANTMAAEALRNTINIPPTLYKNQGERINVFVARDLSFEGVYDVVLK